jgi:hypothetical protein
MVSVIEGGMVASDSSKSAMFYTIEKMSPWILSCIQSTYY